MIANFSVLDKIFESHLVINLSINLGEFKILDRKQFAYQNRIRLNHQLANLSGYLYENLRNKEHTIGAFIDIKLYPTINCKPSCVQLSI